MEKNKGFSLVELIIVIAVMAILTGIIAPQFLGYTDEAKRNVAIRNCRTVVKTTEVYIAETEDVLLEAPFDVIKENSNVKGEIQSIQINSEGTITYLRYKELYTVVYENNEYVILEDEGNGEEPSEDGWILRDNEGMEHIFQGKLDRDEFFALMTESESNGISIPSGTVLKDGDEYYVVGYNDWFSNNGNESIGDYSNVIKLESENIYTENDMVESWGEMVWPNSMGKGDVCYYDGSYYIAPNTINIYTKPPGGWIKIDK